VQAVRDSAVAAVQGLLGMAGQMAASGMDPTAILTGATNFIKGRQDGKAVEDLLGELFPAPEPPPAPEPGSMEAAAAEAGGAPTGAPAPEAPQPGQPGGPGVQDLIASMRAGRPAMSASVRRRTVAA
jgi:hypothetical protein